MAPGSGSEGSIIDRLQDCTAVDPSCDRSRRVPVKDCAKASGDIRKWRIAVADGSAGASKFVVWHRTPSLLQEDPNTAFLNGPPLCRTGPATHCMHHGKGRTASSIGAPCSAGPRAGKPSPVYQCKKALRRNMAVKYSATLTGKFETQLFNLCPTRYSEGPCGLPKI